MADTTNTETTPTEYPQTSTFAETCYKCRGVSHRSTTADGTAYRIACTVCPWTTEGRYQSKSSREASARRIDTHARINRLRK